MADEASTICQALWRGVEGVAATLRLVEAAEAAEATLDARHASLVSLAKGGTGAEGGASGDAAVAGVDAALRASSVAPRRSEAIAWHGGIVRPATSLKQAGPYTSTSHLPRIQLAQVCFISVTSPIGSLSRLYLIPLTLSH
jgi:hypothetical protein